MSTQHASWLVGVLALFAFGVMPQFSADYRQFKQLDESEFAVFDTRLRSAYLQRATGIDCAPGATTAQGRQRTLQRHFDAVIDILNDRAESSVELALNRLERHEAQTWSAEQRRDWRARLAAKRLVNIQRLKLYRDRGRFPINEHAHDRAVPVFVDNYDTACAVGHLMREAGWGAEVAAVQMNNNLVYVTDVGDGAVVDWVATSGLTQEEAALIQPAYSLPPTFQYDARVAELLGGSIEFIEKNGLRYSNFAASYAIGDEFMSPVRMKLAAQQGSQGEGDTWRISPKYNDWLLMAYQSFSFEGTSPRWMELTYLVEAVHPSAFIDAVSLYSNAGTLPMGGIRVSSFVSHADGLTGLNLHHLTYNSLSSPREVSTSFSPTKKVWVATTVQVNAGARFVGYAHSFHVIPEPAACSLIAVGSCCGILGRRRRLESRQASRLD